MFYSALQCNAPSLLTSRRLPLTSISLPIMSSGRKVMRRRRKWEAATPGPERIQLGLQMIDESKVLSAYPVILSDYIISLVLFHLPLSLLLVLIFLPPLLLLRLHFFFSSSSFYLLLLYFLFSGSV